MGVYKRGKTCQAIIRIKDHETVCHTFATKAQDEEWYDETRFEIRRGRYFSRKEVESTTLAEALERYDREILPSPKSQRPAVVRLIGASRNVIERIMGDFDLHYGNI